LSAFQQISPTFRLLGRVFFVCFFFIFFSAHRRKKISVNRSAKTVKDRKISKTDLDSCDTELSPDDKFGGVAGAICSQEHCPPFCFLATTQKPYEIKKKNVFVFVL